jgi:phage baseplate assembly protein W
MTETKALRFPLAVAPSGRLRAAGRAERIRGEIIQLLFTAPGERVNRPDFGCGLFKLVFDPSNEILAAAMEFTVGQALTRWLGDELAVDGVAVAAADEVVTIEIVWVDKADLSRQAVRVQFR